MADNYTFKDAGGNTVTHASKDTGSGVQATRHIDVDEANVALAKAEDAAHSSGDKGIMLLAVRKDTAAALAGTDGDYIPLIVDSSGRLHVTGTQTAAAGDVAHDAADSGNPIKIGGRASLDPPTGVSVGDRVQAFFDQYGRQIVKLDEGTLDRINYPPAVDYGLALIGEVEDRSNGAGANTTDTNMDRLRLGREQELIVMPPTRWANGNSSSVTNIADIVASTVSAYDGGFATPTAAFFDGADAGFGSAARWLRIPMLSFSRGMWIGITNTLGVSLNVKLCGGIVAATSSLGMLRPLLDEVDLGNGLNAWFCSMPAATGADAAIRYVPQLNAPLSWVTLELTPASDPSSGGIYVAVAR